MRVVLDTNVLVSAFISPSGSPGRIRQALREAAFELVLSDPLLAEYRRALNYPKVAARHSRSTSEIDQEIESLRSFSYFVHTWNPLRVILEDPADDKFLECAKAGGAEVIVSGDKHLLSLGTFEGIQILSPTSFLALLG